MMFKAKSAKSTVTPLL